MVLDDRQPGNSGSSSAVGHACGQDGIEQALRDEGPVGHELVRGPGLHHLAPAGGVRPQDAAHPREVLRGRENPHLAVGENELTGVRGDGVRVRRRSCAGERSPSGWRD